MESTAIEVGQECNMQCISSRLVNSLAGIGLAIAREPHCEYHFGKILIGSLIAAPCIKSLYFYECLIKERL
jgi:hypothetical protein